MFTRPWGANWFGRGPCHMYRLGVVPDPTVELGAACVIGTGLCHWCKLILAPYPTVVRGTRPGPTPDNFERGPHFSVSRAVTWC